MIQGFVLLLSLTINFPGDIPTKSISQIDDILQISLASQAKASILAFNLRNNPPVQADIVLSGKILAF